MVYRVKRDPVIDNNRVLRVDRMRVNSFSKLGIGSNTSQGFRTGGVPDPSTAQDTIEKFPFASDANATDVGNLTVARGDLSATNSSVSVYSAGGKAGSGMTTGAGKNEIDKFSISSGGNATNVGDMSTAGSTGAGQQSSSHGYGTGGGQTPPFTLLDRIDKYSFSSDGNASDIGNLTVARFRQAGQSSLTNGYTSGGGTLPPFTVRNEIDKFPFATDTNATDVGDLVTSAEGGDGQSSAENGYMSGGWGPGNLNVIQKFPFSADAGSSDVGDLTVARPNVGGGSSSDNNGYTLGGNNTNIIDKFPFSSDTDATDVGDLTVTTRDGGGAQG